MTRTALPGFILHCRINDQVLHTNETWRSQKDDAVQLVPSFEWDYRLGPPFLNMNEKVDGRKIQMNWCSLEYDDANWSLAELRSMTRKMSPMLDARRLTPRPIPALPEDEQLFDNAVASQGAASLQQWNGLLQSQSPLELPPNSTSTVEFESNVLTTGFLQLECMLHDSQGNDGATITILCAESYENDMDQGQPQSKGDRTDFKNGKLYGPIDTYICHRGLNYYEPFWWRTCRYIRLKITCKSAALTLTSLHLPLNSLPTRHPNPAIVYTVRWRSLEDQS